MPSKRKPASHPVETEAKIRVTSFVAIRRRIVKAGGRLTTPRTLEVNTLFDSPAGPLRASGSALRVRRYGRRGSVTLKGPARVMGGIKSRLELETRVDSPEALSQILISIGFNPQFRYEKFREIWKVGRTEICLDETPLGRFVEIEGDPSAIHRMAQALELATATFLTSSYPGLWRESGHTGDMVFAKKPGRRQKQLPKPQVRNSA